MLKERTELEENLIPVIEDIQKNKRTVNKLKKGFLKFDLHEAEIQKYFSFPEEIRESDSRVLYLLTEVAFEHTKDMNIDPKFYFTENEIKEAN
jgi:hypothetical protein